jgi:hypothetical protein
MVEGPDSPHACPDHLVDLLALCQLKWGTQRHRVVDLEKPSPEELTKKLACAIWEKSGRQTGRDAQNWQEAQQFVAPEEEEATQGAKRVFLDLA